MSKGSSPSPWQSNSYSLSRGFFSEPWSFDPLLGSRVSMLGIPDEKEDAVQWGMSTALVTTDPSVVFAHVVFDFFVLVRGWIFLPMDTTRPPLTRGGAGRVDLAGWVGDDIEFSFFSAGYKTVKKEAEYLRSSR